MKSLNRWIVSGLLLASVVVNAETVPVNVDNFVRAESDTYFAKTVKEIGLGKFHHQRKMVSVENQPVVRMNRDTLYSQAVFDLDAGPVTLTLPDAGSRYMALGDVNQDHYVSKIIHGGESVTYTKDKVGTRYVSILVRVLANPLDPKDMKAAIELQDKIKVEQAATGKFEIPQWETASLDKVRGIIKELGSVKGTNFQGAFGSKAEVNPIDHLIGAAVGWGGNPASESMYFGVLPKQNDGKTVYRLTVDNVPVKAFWSISVYNGKGFFEKNSLNSYSVNNLTAKKSEDGSVTVQFGGCSKGTANCLPIVKGWNYTVRMYQPEKSVINGEWKFPEAQPVGRGDKLSLN